MTDQTPLTGHSIVAGRPVPGEAGTTRAVDPRTGAELGPDYTLLAVEQLAAATRAAADAAPVLASLEPGPHADFLADVADRLDAVGDDLVARAGAETGLPEARLRGELARTTNQLRLFARVVRRGDHRGVRVDPAQPERTPLPRPDVRRRLLPRGPVAVFGASNFPLAFSVAGGDTASALAAGCPVVVKAHNAHPGTSEIVGRAVSDAVAAAGLPAGTFSLVYGPGARIGQALAADPAVAGVGFTGSRAAGTSLMRTASERPVPVPVYAEMSSVNPVVLLPGALAGDSAALAQAYVTSVTGSCGQLCTAPGLVLVPAGADGDRFLEHVAAALPSVAGQPMLTPGIAQAWRDGAAAAASRPGVTEVARGPQGEGPNAPGALVLATDVATFAGDPALAEEVFGAFSLVVRYADAGELTGLLAGLEGQLTATLHLDTGRAQDVETARGLLPVLERTVGRILIGGWPTGVEVNDAMVHGGPYPATSDGASTSVGTAAIERWLRPVAYQGFPEELLPAPVQEANPWGLARRVDGELRPVGEPARS